MVDIGPRMEDSEQFVDTDRKGGGDMDCTQLDLVNVPRLTLGQHLWANADQLTTTVLGAAAEQHSRTDKRFSASITMHYCPGDCSPLELLESAGNRFCRASVAVSSSQEHAGVLRLQESDNEPAFVAVVPTQFSDVVMLLTDVSKSSEPYRRMLKPLFRRTSRRLPTAWISTQQLQNIVIGASRQSGLPVVPTRVSSDSRDGSAVRFPRNVKADSLFEKLEQEDAILRSVDFVLGTRGRPVLRAGVDRTGRVSYRSGPFVTLEQLLLGPVQAHIQRHYRNVSISREEALSGRDILFRFRRDVMADTTANFRLIETLGRLPRASINAYHSNPYLHVAITDLWDGSTMDLYSHAANELVVIPGMRCSAKAVSRVFDQVYDHFGSGDLADLPDVLPASPGVANS